jgi:hypothetical protein
MTGVDTAYLVLILVAFGSFMAVLAWATKKAG